jgi:hypothetical protein
MLNLLNRLADGHALSAVTMLMIARSIAIPLVALLLSKEITLIVIDMGHLTYDQHFGHFMHKRYDLLSQLDLFQRRIDF